MENANDIRAFEDKEILISTKDNLHYKTSNMKFKDGMIVFDDKFDKKILLDIGQIKSIQEGFEKPKKSEVLS